MLDSLREKGEAGGLSWREDLHCKILEQGPPFFPSSLHHSLEKEEAVSSPGSQRSMC